MPDSSGGENTRKTPDHWSTQCSRMVNRPAEGMLKITGEMGPIPPTWVVYFAVGDCAAKAQKVTELGGRVLKLPDNIPGIGRFPF